MVKGVVTTLRQGRGIPAPLFAGLANVITGRRRERVTSPLFADHPASRLRALRQVLELGAAHAAAPLAHVAEAAARQLLADEEGAAPVEARDAEFRLALAICRRLVDQSFAGPMQALLPRSSFSAEEARVRIRDCTESRDVQADLARVATRLAKDPSGQHLRLPPRPRSKEKTADWLDRPLGELLKVGSGQ